MPVIKYRKIYLYYPHLYEEIRLKRVLFWYVVSLSGQNVYHTRLKDAEADFDNVVNELEKLKARL